MKLKCFVKFDEKVMKKKIKHSIRLYNGYKEKLSQEELEFIALKFELLRRNKEYQKFYEKYKAIFYDTNNTGCSPEEKDLFSRIRYDFGICFPLDPSRKVTKSFLKKDVMRSRILCDLLDARPVMDRTPVTGPSLKGNKDEQGRLKWEPIPEKFLARTHILKLEVNINYSEKIIVQEVRKILRSHTQLKRKYKLDRKRFRPSDLKYYLKIWDYKQAYPNATWKTIARAIYPKSLHIERVQEDKVAKAYKACCQLIAGDYKKITL